MLFPEGKALVTSFLKFKKKFKAFQKNIKLDRRCKILNLRNREIPKNANFQNLPRSAPEELLMSLIAMITRLTFCYAKT